MISHNRPKTEATALHKYVLICVGCLFLFLVTFPVAYWRVSQKMNEQEKSPQVPLKSLDWHQNQKANLDYPN